MGSTTKICKDEIRRKLIQHRLDLYRIINDRMLHILEQSLWVIEIFYAFMDGLHHIWRQWRMPWKIKLLELIELSDNRLKLSKKLCFLIRSYGDMCQFHEMFEFLWVECHDAANDKARVAVSILFPTVKTIFSIVWWWRNIFCDY